MGNDHGAAYYPTSTRKTSKHGSFVGGMGYHNTFTNGSSTGNDQYRAGGKSSLASSRKAFPTTPDNRSHLVTLPSSMARFRLTSPRSHSLCAQNVCRPSTCLVCQAQVLLSAVLARNLCCPRQGTPFSPSTLALTSPPLSHVPSPPIAPRLRV